VLTVITMVIELHSTGAKAMGACSLGLPFPVHTCPQQLYLYSMATVA